MKILRVDGHATGDTNDSNVLRSNRKWNCGCKYMAKTTQKKKSCDCCVHKECRTGHLPELIIHNTDSGLGVCGINVADPYWHPEASLFLSGSLSNRTQRTKGHTGSCCYFFFLLILIIMSGHEWQEDSCSENHNLSSVKSCNLFGRKCHIVPLLISAINIIHTLFTDCLQC